MLLTSHTVHYTVKLKCTRILFPRNPRIPSPFGSDVIFACTGVYLHLELCMDASLEAGTWSAQCLMSPPLFPSPHCAGPLRACAGSAAACDWLPRGKWGAVAILSGLGGGVALYMYVVRRAGVPGASASANAPAGACWLAR